jgi:hypothetical protein
MTESADFLASLQHSNSERPTFSIDPGGTGQLDVWFQGKHLRLPMSEVLNFARRWQADFEQRRQAMQRAGSLMLFPYPLYNTKLDDPDCTGVWWVNAQDSRIGESPETIDGEARR